MVLYATLQLANGTDIYTVSKMLGHTSVKTTQVYAKVVDEKKQKDSVYIEEKILLLQKNIFNAPLFSF